MSNISEHSSYQDDTPIILVPGFMASRLWRNRKGLLNPTILVWPLSVYPLLTQLNLLQDEYPLSAEGLVGDYYDGLIDFIVRPVELGGLGRIKDYNFWVFPYDWRQSCHLSGQQLHQFIQAKLAEANQQRQASGRQLWSGVDIINHSMGGYVTRSAMVEFAAPVRRVVYIASGHYGTAKAFFALHPDTVLNVVDDFVKGFIPGWYWEVLKTLPNVWIVESWLARLLDSFQSVYELLPDQFYLEEQYLIEDDTHSPARLIYGVEETYFRHPWHLSLEKQARIKKALEFKAHLGRDLPGQENLVIYSSTYPTYNHAHFKGKLQPPELVANGDTTIPALSASQDEKAEKVLVKGIHSALPNLPTTHQAIRAFMLAGNNQPSLAS